MLQVRRFPRLAAAAVLVVFLLANARGLDSTPLVSQDEAWIAAPGMEFFASGHFATRVFAGYFGSERHYYDFMPLYSLLDGAVIRTFGQSLITVRSLSLTLAAFTLLMTFLVARRMLTEWHGVVAMLNLAAWPIAAGNVGADISGLTGIPLTDLGRIGRYDILVPVFGLAALLALLRGLDRDARSERWLITSGALAGLATLSHYYGVVWLAVIFVLIAATTRVHRARQLACAALGWVVTMVPWVWFVSRDVSMFVAQKAAQWRDYSGGLGSVTDELSRYSPVVNAARHGHMVSVFWIAAVIAGVGLLARSGWRHPAGARLLSITTAVVMVCFVLFVRRNFKYLATMWPLLALAASFAILHPWPRRMQTVARVILALLVIGASAKGVQAYSLLAMHSRQVTSYTAVCDRIVLRLPASARLLAMQHWWLGVGPRVGDYRSFLVPATRMNPRTGETPLSFAAAMALDPMDYVLVDPVLADLIQSASDTSRPVASAMGRQVGAFLAERGTLVDTFTASPYGEFRLYRVTTGIKR